MMLLLLVVAEPEPGVLTGTVADAEGRPVAGVEVVLAEVALPPGGQTSRSSFRAPSSPPVVLRRIRSDDAGGFRLPLVVQSDDRARQIRPRILWAHRAGASAAFQTIPPYWPPDGEPVRLTLGRPTPITVRVLGPDGQPAAGARVAPARLRGVPLHPELGDAVAVRADAAGRAVLEAVAPEDLEQLRVTSEPYGVQVVRAPRPEGEGEERVVRLADVGRVEGRIKADDPRAVRGLAVHVRTAPDPAADEAGVGGIAEVVTDDQGRFTVPAIAEGALALVLETRRDLPFRGRFLDRPPVEAGGTTTVEVALKRAVLIKGIVRESGTGAPVAGAGVSVEWLTNLALARTDEQGRYADYSLPGPVRFFVSDAPPGFYNPTSVIATDNVPEGVAEFTVAPLELARGATLAGRVVGPDGRPVPGAEVIGSWVSSMQRGRWARAMTDRTGAFRIEGMNPRDEIRLSARRGDAVTAAPVAARAGAEPVTLTIDPAHAVALAGRAVGPEGEAVAGAIVRITSRRGNGRTIGEDRVVFDDDGHATLTTGPDGRYQTPRSLRPDLEYCAEVEAEGRVPARTEWVNPALTRDFLDVVLAPVVPTRTVAGRVVDADGRPLAGAIVSQSGDGPKRTSVVADGQGRFRLPGVVREPAFLFVAGSGLRFSGHRIAAVEDAVALRAPRAGDPPGRTLHTLPPLLPRDQEKALALRLIGPEIEGLTRKEVTADTNVLLDIVPRVDPARSLELAEKGALPRAELSDRVRLNAALGLIDESPEEATTIAETIKKPSLRAQFDLEASDALPASDHARKVEWLDRALVQAHAEPDPITRLLELGRIGERLLDLGAAERGAAVLREGQRLADTLPKFGAPGPRAPGSFARGQFATMLARIDVAAALAIAREFSERYADRYFSGIALRLADRDPAASEEALGRIANKAAREILVERIAGRIQG